MKSKNVVITRTELDEAVKKFLKNGGLFKRLPPQVNPYRHMVGANWAMFETMPIVEEVFNLPSA